jgi:HAD superfamily hydrolase (TIGR01509 family)
MKCLAFDLGRVVFDFDYNIALEKIRDRISVPEDVVMEALFYKDFGLDFEKGLISGRDFYLKFKSAFGCHLDYDEFADVWCSIFYPNKKVLELIEKLKPLYPVYLITNINQLHFNHLYHNFKDFFSMFDELILSFKVGSVKPERRIYEYLERVSGAKPKDIIYIDDREDLIVEAKRMGFRCIRFMDFQTLLESLKQEKVYILNEEERLSLLQIKDKISGSEAPLILGVGNSLRGDDGIGALLARELKDKISVDTLNVEGNLENYLGKIKDYSSLVIIDAAHYLGDTRFKVISPNKVKNTPLNFTHDLPLNFLSEYLKKEGLIDILILALKGYNFKVGDTMSEKVKETKEVIESFFVRNFSNILSLET